MSKLLEAIGKLPEIDARAKVFTDKSIAAEPIEAIKIIDRDAPLLREALREALDLLHEIARDWEDNDYRCCRNSPGEHRDWCIVPKVRAVVR